MLGWIRRLAHGSEPTSQAEQTDSEAALERTRTARQQAEERRSIVESVVAPIRRARVDNHWAERIEAAYAARRGAAQ
ncbi:hypothetical protein ACF061_00550 [Streptomyces sp. NPDC015220]|uniref:DUF7620 family protein n=1 Tax=Streptomyces sp. NPDC015220 TaxID=3364947 RepID=UPI0036FBDD05